MPAQCFFPPPPPVPAAWTLSQPLSRLRQPHADTPPLLLCRGRKLAQRADSKVLQARSASLERAFSDTKRQSADGGLVPRPCTLGRWDRRAAGSAGGGASNQGAAHSKPIHVPIWLACLWAQVSGGTAGGCRGEALVWCAG